MCKQESENQQFWRNFYFLNKIFIQIKQLLDKQKNIQKIEIMPKRLEIGIHNVSKNGLKIKLYIYI
jgi:hypothetical protein